VTGERRGRARRGVANTQREGGLRFPFLDDFTVQAVGGWDNSLLESAQRIHEEDSRRGQACGGFDSDDV